MQSNRSSAANRRSTLGPGQQRSVSVAVTALVAFVFHFIWEIAQCRLFFVHGTDSLTVVSMLGATLGDLAMTAVVFILVLAVTKDPRWIFQRWTLTHWLTLEVTALIFSIGVEKIALRLERWSYTEITPLLPLVNVSLLPVLQLVFLFPAIFYVAAKLLELVGDTHRNRETDGRWNGSD